MTWSERNIVGAVMGVVLISWLVACLGLTFRVTVTEEQRSPLRFEAARALQFTREFVTRHPKRVLGSFEARGSTGYLQSALTRFGYRISYGHFNALVGGRRETGRNVLALKPGAEPEIIAVLANYDVARSTLQGAMDNGSGVGVLLELARVFGEEPTRKSILFIASDGGVWGNLGADEVASNYQDRARIAAALSLDYVASGELESLRLDVTGRARGFSPPWLRETARRAVRESGIALVEPAGLSEHLERAVRITRTDQAPFVDRGIPSINLGSSSKDRWLEESVRHSAQDTPDLLSIASFESYGKTAERIVRSLLAGTRTVPESPAPFRVQGSAYLNASTTAVLHWLTFLPPFVLISLNWRRVREVCNSKSAIREVFGIGVVVLPLCLSYGAIFMFRFLRWIPRFDAYPPPPQDPLAQQPSWAVVLLLLGIVIVLTPALHYARLRLLGLPRSGGSSRVVLLCVLAVIALAALIHNSWWAAVFVGVPAWIWGLAGLGRGRGRWFIGCLGMAAAFLPLFFIPQFVVVIRLLEYKALWYGILVLSSNMLPSSSVLLGIAVVGVGVRFCLLEDEQG